MFTLGLISFELRDSIGDSAMAGDSRWSGTYGVNIDFVARSHCAVEIIPIEEIQAIFIQIPCLEIFFLW